MSVIPTRFPVDFGDVFSAGVLIVGVEPTLEFSDGQCCVVRMPAGSAVAGRCCI
jgi:hypothetical protein